jgi:hypothetical protein
MTRAERRQEWEARIAAADYRASGQSAKDWCASNNLKPGQLWYQLSRDSSGKTGPAMQKTKWLPVEVRGESICPI